MATGFESSRARLRPWSRSSLNRLDEFIEHDIASAQHEHRGEVIDQTSRPLMQLHADGALSRNDIDIVIGGNERHPLKLLLADPLQARRRAAYRRA